MSGIEYGPYNRHSAKSSRDFAQREYERLLVTTPEGREELKAFLEANPLMTRQQAKRALAASLKKEAEDRLRDAQPEWRKGLSRADMKSDGIVDTGVTRQPADVKFELRDKDIRDDFLDLKNGYWRSVTDCNGNTFSVWCKAS